MGVLDYCHHDISTDYCYVETTTSDSKFYVDEMLEEKSFNYKFCKNKIFYIPQQKRNIIKEIMTIKKQGIC